MTYATVMVHLKAGQSNANLLKVTGDLATRLEAGVVGIVTCQEQQLGYGEVYASGDVIEKVHQELDNEIEAAATEFRTALSQRVHRIDWRSTLTFAPLGDFLAQQARCADVFVTGVERHDSIFDMTRHVDLGDLVMQIGRPVIVVPAAVETLNLDHVVLFWKNTRECRRAAADALPILKSAGQVSIIEIAAEADLAEARDSLHDVVAWLAHHGIAASSAAVAAGGDDSGQLDTIAQTQSADLVIAGAYGHSRMREWALGGVTRTLLTHPARCSLISH